MATEEDPELMDTPNLQQHMEQFPPKNLKTSGATPTCQANEEKKKKNTSQQSA